MAPYTYTAIPSEHCWGWPVPSGSRIERLVCGTRVPKWHRICCIKSVWIWSSALLLPGLQLPMKNFIDYDRLLAGHPAGEEINSDPLIVFDYPLRTLSSLFTPLAACRVQLPRPDHPRQRDGYCH